MLAIILLSYGFVYAQSITGTLLPNSKQNSPIVLPSVKAVNPADTNYKDVILYTSGSQLPKGAFLPNKGQNNVLLPRSIHQNTMDTAKNNIAVAEQAARNAANNTDFLYGASGSTGETIDTTGFSKIPTLETNPVPDLSAGFSVDTARLIEQRNNPQAVMSSRVNALSYEVDTTRLLSKRNNSMTAANSIISSSALPYEVDTARLLKTKGNVASNISTHYSPFMETVDTAALLAKMRPSLQFDSANSIFTKPRFIYKSQNIIGEIVPEKGKSTLFKPLEIDTSTYVPQVDSHVKDSLDQVADRMSKDPNRNLGELADLTPNDTVPKMIIPNALGELGDLDEVSTNKDIDKPQVDPFYQFHDGTVYYDTSKVITNTRGQSFTGSLTSKLGKSTVLQPIPKGDADVVPLAGSSVSADNSMTGNGNSSPNPLPNNTDQLTLTFNVMPTGKYYLTFTSNTFYINVSQWGNISDYVFTSNDMKNQGNNNIHKNALGLVDNIAGNPIEYTADHLVSGIGTWPIKYTFDNMVNSVGVYKVYYNSNAGLKKIDKYKIIYDTNKTVLNIDESGGLIVLRSEEAKKL